VNPPHAHRPERWSLLFGVIALFALLTLAALLVAR